MFGDEPEALSRAVKAFGELGAGVVLVVLEEQARNLGPVPENVRMARDFPGHLVLRSSDAVVHQWQWRPAMSALACGVPEVACRCRATGSRWGGAATAPGASTTLAGFLAGYEENRVAIASALDGPAQRHAAEVVCAEMRRGWTVGVPGGGS
ncbi:MULTISPECIES: glycosyltransferase [Amycolatopsis]|uniref:Glycosyltransferase n=1 Tax=Amycolatopsis albidoflavus TaxID=102226 RepID=A0ABW5IAA5_9PSEU